jgi:hypothetical protein
MPFRTIPILQLHTASAPVKADNLDRGINLAEGQRGNLGLLEVSRRHLISADGKPQFRIRQAGVADEVSVTLLPQTRDRTAQANHPEAETYSSS